MIHIPFVSVGDSGPCPSNSILMEILHKFKCNGVEHAGGHPVHMYWLSPWEGLAHHHSDPSSRIFLQGDYYMRLKGTGLRE